MLSTGAFPPPCNSTFLPSRQCYTAASLLLPPKGHLPVFPITCSTGPLYAVFCENHSIFSSSTQFQLSLPSFRRVSQVHGCGLIVRALNKRGEAGIELAEMDDFDDDDNDEFDDEEDEDDEAGEDEMLVPLENMKQWLKNKPRGFGEGKVFDTSIEEKLLEEMEQSQQAQAANIDKLKKNPIKPTAKKEGQVKAASEVVPNGVRVRVGNLPKKRNIQRDLKSAFLGVPGILNIIPAVSGSKKTRDPVCKGFAFVDFKSEEDAARFEQAFSRQSIMFGKIQKQIKCEILNPESPNSNHVRSTEIPYSAFQLTVPDLEEDRKKESNRADSSRDSCEETNSYESDDLDTELVGANVEHISKNLESISVLSVDGDDSMETTTDSLSHSFSPKIEKSLAPKKKLRAEGKGDMVPEKKIPVKVKGENVLEKKPQGKERRKEKRETVPKLGVPGSAKRLKIKEKSLLTDVFSKYGVKAALASKEGS